ncbi:hypothetical protein EU348_03525 [Chryseobacterium indologenes]|uniref:RHS repeat protein n=1 Tax=Chryseobacterium indologenes TaxID=253 RepID=A0A411DIU8_CHRID|nr:hypothetical protein EU348_03525 [Chryseobacterium indologenes]
MRKIIICAGLLLANTTFAQVTTPPNEVGKNVPAIFPPTPESFKFGTFGNIPTGLFTGSTNIDVPLTSLSSGSNTLPVSLNYSSNGIKVDDTNGSVGLGWRFISAGVITRVIRDLPDELNTQGNIETPNIDALGLNDPAVVNYLTLCKNDDFDSEPDLYMANFSGKNLKFIIKKNGEIVQLEKSGCKIDRANGGFVIKTEDGTEYTFNSIEKVRNFMTDTGEHPGGALTNVSSWYLSKVKSIENREINIDYYDVNFTAVTGKSQSMIFTKGNGSSKYGSPTTNPNQVSCPVFCNEVLYSLPPSMGLVSESNQSVWGKQIKKIYDQDGNYIFFEYQQRNEDYYLLKTIKKYASLQLIESFDLNYDITANDRVFLKSVNEIKSGRKYSFEYNNSNSFPDKLNFGRDMWGYYNGTMNTSLIPQIYKDNDPFKVNYSGADQRVNASLGQLGLLKKIIYPTGGSTNITYENHKMRELVTIPAQQGSTGTETFNDRNTYSSSSQITITPAVDGVIQISGGNALYGEGNCFNSPILTSQKQAADITVYDSNGIVLRTESYSTDSGGVFTIDGQKNKPITLKATARFACSFASVHATYYISEPTQGYQDQLLGGYRVASTTDESEGSTPVTKTYDYVNADGSYSTIQAYQPYFLEDRSSISVCTGSNCLPPLSYSYSILTSTNVNQYNSFNPNIFYSRVVESLGARGKIVHEFDTGIDEYGSIGGDVISGTAHSNTAWKSGKELSLTYLDGNGNLIKKVENKYAEDNTGINTTFSLATRKKFELIGGGSGGIGEFDNLDFVLYKNISRFSYLQNQKTTDYLNGNAMKTEVNYFYNNPNHYQLTSSKTEHPDHSISETTYSYAHEKNNQLMIDKNMVGIPLETKAQQTANNITKVTSREETIYPTVLPHAVTGNLVLPLSEYSYDSLNPAVSSKEVTYEKYDEKGNILQYREKDGTPVSIVWGYNKTKPIAKVVGALYSQIEGQIGTIVTKSNEDAADPTKEAELLLALDAFQPAGMVTKYTYDPLVGVTTITPPSGVRELYVYDTANRLKQVQVRERDNTGTYSYKVVKEFKYNYKP